MLSSVASNSLECAIIHAKRDIESNYGSARLDQIEILLINTSLGSSVVEVELDLFQETRFTVGIKARSGLLDGEGTSNIESGSLF